METKHVIVPEPCNQSWEDMQPDENGRFRGTCRQTIIDFSKYKDDDFIAYFQNPGKQVFGRFTKRQFRIGIPELKSIALQPEGSAIPAGTVDGDGERLPLQPEQEQNIVVLTGTVVTKNKRPLPAARVRLANSRNYAVTTPEGVFFLPTGTHNRAGTLEVTARGYKNVVLHLKELTGNELIQIDMEEYNSQDFPAPADEAGISQGQTFWQQVLSVLSSDNDPDRGNL